MSGSAPAEYATTGVPQAIASIATSELVSGMRLGINRQRAAIRKRRLRTKPRGPKKRTVGPSRGWTSVAKSRSWAS